MLGRAQVMADYLQMAYEEVERHAVDLANVHAELATFSSQIFLSKRRMQDTMGGSRVGGASISSTILTSIAPRSERPRRIGIKRISSGS